MTTTAEPLILSPLIVLPYQEKGRTSTIAQAATFINKKLQAVSQTASLVYAFTTCLINNSGL